MSMKTGGKVDEMFQEFNVAVCAAGMNLIHGLERLFGSVASAFDVIGKGKTRKIQETFVEPYGDENGSDFRVSKDAATGNRVSTVGSTPLMASESRLRAFQCFSQNFDFRFGLALFKQPRMTRKSTVRVGRAMHTCVAASPG
jgi:hypothetical protein